MNHFQESPVSCFVAFTKESMDSVGVSTAGMSMLDKFGELQLLVMLTNINQYWL
jgi:hypothetical protein